MVGRILILEPEPEIRELLMHVAARLGHDAVTNAAELHGDIDAVVLEPQSSRGLARAEQIRRRFPDVPIVCTSILPPSRATRELRPVAHLVKPFALDELERVLARALDAASVGRV